MIDDLWTAWTTLSRFPAPSIKQVRLQRSTLFFPTVGWTVTGLLIAFDWLLKGVMPENLRAGVLLIGYYFLFGYFHFDGFLDAVDGFLASHKTPAQRYAIMKDPHIGAFALLFGALTLLLQYQATLHFSPNWFLFPLFGRIAIPWMLSVSQPFSKEGLAAGYYPYPRRYGFFSSIFLLPLCLYPPFWPTCLVGVAVSLAVIAVLRWASLRLMGGINGDVLGCVCILTEVGFLLVNTLLR